MWVLRVRGDQPPLGIDQHGGVEAEPVPGRVRVGALVERRVHADAVPPGGLGGEGERRTGLEVLGRVGGYADRGLESRVSVSSGRKTTRAPAPAARPMPRRAPRRAR